MEMSLGPDKEPGTDVRIVDYKEFNELRNQVEMLFGFLAGKGIITAEEIGTIIKESKKTLEDLRKEDIDKFREGLK